MVSEFAKERDEAFLSGDKEKIIAYCKKYDIQVPEDEEVFWIGVHKAICNLFLAPESPITIEQFNKSCDWLAEHGHSPSIMGGEN